MYWKVCPELPLTALASLLLLCPEIPDQPLAELEVEARDMSEGNRFMIRICSNIFLTHEETISSFPLS